MRWRNEIRVLLDVTNQPFLVLTELEVIVLFLQLNHLAINRIKRTVGQAVLFRQQRLSLRRVIARIHLAIKVALGMQLGQKRLHVSLMSWLSGADEIINSK